MPKLFISYRQSDSQHVADNVFGHMKRQFGKENVFMDVGSGIPAGVDYRPYLRNQIAAHDVILVLIGPAWAQSIKEKASRPNDFVRLEIEYALELGKILIPLLVMNAAMPDFGELPASIQDLQYRSGREIHREPLLEDECARLAEEIRQIIAAPAQRETLLSVLNSPSVRSLPRSKSVELMPPPFEWIEIPAGKVTLINDWDDDPKVYLKKDQPQTFDVPAFAIAKYPITNDQYSLFVNAGGYRDSRWWTGHGWEIRQQENWLQPRYWKNTNFNGATQPVVGVSWYETIAFCKWFSDVSGEAILLPTEQQRQRAVQGDDGRQYPWGNDFDLARCNTFESKIGRTTTVTQYAGKGDSPFGVTDMAGNVWEWCLTEYESGDSDIEGSGVRVMRGGSWFNPPMHARADYRIWPDPNLWASIRGFRVVLGSVPM